MLLLDSTSDATWTLPPPWNDHVPPETSRAAVRIASLSPFTYQNAPGLRPDPSNKETGGDGRGTVGAAGVSGSQASHIHWCAFTNNSLGSSRPSFTSEVPA